MIGIDSCPFDSSVPLKIYIYIPKLANVSARYHVPLQQLDMDISTGHLHRKWFTLSHAILFWDTNYGAIRTFLRSAKRYTSMFI
jgi:hypothetical protein